MHTQVLGEPLSKLALDLQDLQLDVELPEQVRQVLSHSTQLAAEESGKALDMHLQESGELPAS